jgi:hypothetical protein
MKDDQIRELLHEMRDDPVPADSLARVRQAVMARTSARCGRQGLGVVWKLAVPAALAGCIVAVLLRPPARHSGPMPVQPAPAIEEQAPAPPVATTVQHKAKSRANARAARHFQQKPAPTEQAGGASLIRIETPDPDVVILLLADSGSGNSQGALARQ